MRSDTRRRSAHPRAPWAGTGTRDREPSRCSAHPCGRRSASPPHGREASDGGTGNGRRQPERAEATGRTVGAGGERGAGTRRVRPARRSGGAPGLGRGAAGVVTTAHGGCATRTDRRRRRVLDDRGGPDGTVHRPIVVTEATAPTAFEFVTDATLTTKKGATSVWTDVHRYEIAPEGRGCRIAYTLRVTRISALPGMLRIFNWPVLSSMGVRAAAGMAAKGIANLSAMAEERTAA